jgi:hypothetical protein
MGASASQIVERVKALSDDQLSKFIKDDQELVNLRDQIYDPGFLPFIKDLDKYEIQGSGNIKPPAPGKTDDSETSLYLSISSPSTFSDKHQELRNALQLDILAMRGQDPNSEEVLKRLQALYRIHEALLREEERKKRRGQVENKEEKKKDTLPVAAKVAIRFGVMSLLSLIRSVGPVNPSIYRTIVGQAADILSVLPPNSLQSADPTITEALDSIANFFGQILNGEIKGLGEDEQMGSLSPLLGLAITTGSLGSVLSISQRFLTLEASSDFHVTLRSMLPLINQLHSMAPSTVKTQPIVWDDARKGPDIVISEGGLKVVRTNSSGWGAALSSESITSGINYYEFTVDHAGSDCLLVGVTDVGVSSLTNMLVSECSSFVYQSNGKIYDKGSEIFTSERWSSGGRVGMLVNMDEKHVIFFYNGVMQARDPIGPLSNEVKLYCTFGGSNQYAILNCEADIPESASEYMIQKGLGAKQNPEEEEKEMLSSACFKHLVDGSISEEDLKNTSPACVSSFMLACLDRFNSPLRKRIEGKRSKIKRKEGLGLDVQNGTIESMANMLETCLNHYKEDTWYAISKDICQVATLSLLRLIRSHLMATQYFKDSGVKTEIREKIYHILDQFIEVASDPIIGDEAAITFSNCLEVFYEKPHEKLEYLRSKLEDIRNKVEFSGLRKQLQDRMFEKMSEPDAIYQAFNLDNEENYDRIQTFLLLLIEISIEDSKQLIQNPEYSPSGLTNLLLSCQNAFLSNGAKQEFKGSTQAILLSYAQSVLSGGFDILEELLTTVSFSPKGSDVIRRAKGTILSIVIPNLLNTLVLCKLSLDFATNLLPKLQAFMHHLSKLDLPEPELTNGMGLVTEIYESEHPYPNNLDTRHLIKIPNAKRYHLTFDNQFKTENNCDYLELWLDEDKNSKHSRHEGESFPKERLTIDNPLILFTFHSDGSVNYWGWKITIEAEIETQYYMKEWPSHLKDACRQLAAGISKKLISSEFEMAEEDEEVLKLIKNPLIKYGVTDTCLTQVKQLEPLDTGLVSVSLSQPQHISDEASVAHYVNNYGNQETVKFSTNNFLNEFVEGTDELVAAWNKVKQRAGAIGPSFNVGGHDLDSAERAIFAVYAAFFEITDSMHKLFESQGELTNTLKYLVKQACQIRTWAQGHKQKLMDGGQQDITYGDISKGVITKCSFLVHAEYKLALNELGVKKILLNLISTVTRAQSAGESKLKAGSKWMAVKKAMKTMTLLKNLLSFKKAETQKEDNGELKEFQKVSNMVKEFLESPCPVEKLVQAIERRRTRALARTLGFNCLADMIGNSHSFETSLVRAFSDSLRVKDVKRHFWEGLEGADPYLLQCVKRSFFSVFGFLQSEVAKGANKKVDWEFLHHYLAVIEAMSFPIKDIDSHVLLEFDTKVTVKTILSWAKGQYGEQDLRTLNINEIVYGIQLIPESEIRDGDITVLVSSQEGTNRQFLRLKKGLEGALPIVDISFELEPQEGFEVLVPRTDLGNREISVQVKRAPFNPEASYLTGLTSELVPEYKKHTELLQDMKELEKQKFAELKLKLSQASWKLYKLVLVSTSSPSPINEAKTVEILETLVSSTFEELDLSVEAGLNFSTSFAWLTSGSEWLGLLKTDKVETVADLVERVEFSSLEDSIVKKIIEIFKKFKTPSIQTAKVGFEFPEEFKNTQGDLDLFKLLNAVKANPEALSDYAASFSQILSSSTDLPADSDAYEKLLSVKIQYNSSLLWALSISSGSPCLGKVLAGTDRIVALLKVLFSKGTGKLSVLAARLLRSVLATQHSSQTVELLWPEVASLKFKLNLPNEAKTSLVSSLLAVAGLRINWQLHKADPRKLDLLALECYELLNTLATSDRWQEELTSTLLSLVDSLVSKLEKANFPQDHEIGALGLLSLSSDRNYGSNILDLDWIYAKFKGTSFSRGTIVHQIGTEIRVFNEDEEAFKTEQQTVFDSATLTQTPVFLANLTVHQAQSLLNSINLLYSLLNKSYNFEDSTARDIIAKNSLLVELKYLATQTLSNIIASHEISGDEFTSMTTEIISKIFNTLQETKEVDLNGYRSLLKALVDSLNNLASNPEPAQMTEEEAQQKLVSYNENDQSLAAELLSVGVPLVKIIKAFEAGVKDRDAVSAWEDKKAQKVTQIFSLKKVESELLETNDDNGNASCYQNRKGQFIIRARNPVTYASIKHKLDSSVFKGFNEYIDELTFLATVSLGRSDGTVSLQIGDLTITLTQEGDSTKLQTSSANSTSEPETIKRETNYSFRIFAEANGKTFVVGDNFEYAHKLKTQTVFNGVQIGKYGLEATSGTIAALKGFEIKTGHYLDAYQWVDENIETKPSVEHFLRVAQKIDGVTKLRLSLTGAPSSVLQKYSSNDDLEQSLLDLISSSDSREWETTLKNSFDSPITEIALFDNLSELRHGFIPVKLYSNGELSDYSLANRKILAIKKHDGNNLPGSFISHISIGEQMANHEDIGDLTINGENDFNNHVYIEKGNKDSKNVPLRNLVFVKSEDPYSVKLPLGYSLVQNKEEQAVNLGLKTEAENFLFLAYSESSTLKNCPIKNLADGYFKESKAGLVDDYAASSGSAQDKIKWEEFSLLELYNSLFDFNNHLNYKAGSAVVINLIKKNPEIFTQVAHKVNLGTLLKLVKNDLPSIDKQISSILESSDTSLKQRLLSEVVYQLIISSTETGGAPLKEYNVESVHPYDNNMRVDETIRIPGASRLRVEFDPQCYTENGCDTLRFYERLNHENELRCCTGQGGSSWEPLEVQGDTVHTYFYSDGSVVYWGYKFRVIPIGKSKGPDPLAHKKNVSTAIWLLEKISAYQNLDDVMQEALRNEVLIPLFIFIHSSDDNQLSHRGLAILRRLLRGQKNSVINSMLNIILTESLTLYEKYKDKNNPLLQSIVQILADLKDEYKLEIGDEWFLNFTSTYFDLQGLSDKDQKLEFLLLEQFVKNVSVDFSRSFEVKNYDRKLKETQTELISFPGATVLDIEFDDITKLVDGHSVYFSYDAPGKVPIETGSAKKISNARWCADPKGPDIVLSNENLTVTRTNSSSWGTVLWTESYTTGIIKITFQVDNDGGSEYWYLGLVETTDNYPLSSYIGSDCPNRIWSWKTNGDFHRNGEVMSRSSEFGYRTGDSISLLINMDEKKVTFFKNERELHTFENIADSVRPALCFGGSNQFMTVKSVEILGGVSGPSTGFKKKVKIQGDSIYCHYPINSGYLTVYEWDSDKVAGVTNPNKRSIQRTQAEGEPISVKTTGELNNGRYYLELSVQEMPEGSLISFDLVKQSESLVSFSSVEGVLHNGNLVSSDKFEKGDSLAYLVNFDENVVKVYKNGYSVYSGELSDADTLNFSLKLGAENQLVNIVANPDIPEGHNLMAAGFTKKAKKGALRQLLADEEKQDYHIKYKVVPVFLNRTESVLESQKAFLNPEQLEQWGSYKNKFLELFRNGTASELVMYLDEYSLSKSKQAIDLANEDINPGQKELIYYRQLEKSSVEDMRELYKILQKFNKNVTSNLNLINLHIENKESITKVQSVFIGARQYIFYQVKKGKLDGVISSTHSDPRPNITVDRPKANFKKNRGEVDSQGQFSIFGQIFRALANNENRQFRNSERIFVVEYRGEGAIDAGGPYNEVMTNICEELQSKFLRLLVSVPNQTHNVGEHRDCWIVNPSANTSTDQDLFLFLGKIMGVAIRTQNNLNLTLPPLFWKRLMLEPVTLADLKGVDECCYQMLDILRNLEAQGITEDTFSYAFENETFTTQDSSGNIVELKENGKEIPVVFGNAKEYANLIEKFRLSEGEFIYTLLRKGMSAVVPIDLLNMFSWKQVETLVCGAADIDVEILKNNTDYDSCSTSDRHIQFFWEILKDFTPRERTLFLKFVWGRSKLPAGTDFRHMKITRYNPSGPVDNYLPVSHTCFFTIDLPAYTSKDVMREKLLYAITHCQAIDLDKVASGGWEESAE